MGGASKHVTSVLFLVQFRPDYEFLLELHALTLAPVLMHYCLKYNKFISKGRVNKFEMDTKLQ